MSSAREIALKVLFEIENNKAYSNIELNKKLGDTETSQAEKALATEIVYGVTKWKIKLDWIISQLSTIKINKISPWIVNILRIGIYQIDFLEKIPQSAAVNESVKLAKRYGHGGSVKFVNGVLRNYLRNRDKITLPDTKDMVKYLSIVCSHPEWLVSRWIKAFGVEFTTELCKVNNTVPQLTGRVNIIKTSKEELRQLLQNENINISEGLYFDEAFTIDSNINLSKVDAFRKGLFQIQDESSMLTAHVLDPQPGDTVLDVCAAPGGKSTHIAELMNNTGKLYSRDIHQHKIKLIEENCSRLGIEIVSTKIFDATELDSDLIDKCDKVLVDAPCSGLGIIRRKPDIKYNREIEDKNSLNEIQIKIINTSAKYVKKGGTLVYSTCTIDDSENMGIVQKFLLQNTDYKLVDITQYIPKGLLKESCKEGYIQTYPHIDKIDGFFVSKMIRLK